MWILLEKAQNESLIYTCVCVCERERERERDRERSFTIDEIVENEIETSIFIN